MSHDEPPFPLPSDEQYRRTAEQIHEVQDELIVEFEGTVQRDVSRYGPGAWVEAFVWVPAEIATDAAIAVRDRERRKTA